MKILRIYTRLPPLMGGMEKHIFNLSYEQNKMGHEVTIYFNEGNKVSNRDIQITKLPLHALKPRSFGILIFYFLIVVRLIIKNEKFDVLHIHGDWSSLIFAKIIQKLIKSKILVYSIHDDIKNNNLYKQIFSLFLKQVNIIFSTGFSVAEKIKKISNKEVFVQPSGINNIYLTSRVKRNNSSIFQIITVANLVPKKNLNLILDIAKELTDINFLIVGEGEEREKLQNRISSENIKNLLLLGYKNPEELNKLYRESNLFLLTSFFEGTPTVVLEAMACGLTVVCSNVGGIRRLIPNNCSFFVIDSFIKEEYINVLLGFKFNLEKYTSDENKKFANEYNWEKVSFKITSQLIKEFNK